MFVIEALRAKHGDALLLHFGTAAKPRLAVVDGGPAGVYNDALQPRLMEIRQQRGLAENQPLEIDLMMVSHLDADHIVGIIDLMRRLRSAKESQRPLPWKVKRFWHNAFEDLTGDRHLSAATTASVLSLASASGSLSDESSSLLASVAQGRELRDLVRYFHLDGNSPFRGLVQFKDKAKPVRIANLALTIIGPDETRLARLQADWDKNVAKLLEKEKKAELAAYVDRSVYNLSSIVVLAKANGKSILLTGDARGDDTLVALRSAGLLKDGKPFKVDVLKLPHHGSVRNVDDDYFSSIHASHYLISADGKHSNPDVATLEMISRSRPDDDFTIWLTNAPEDFNNSKVGKDVAGIFRDETARGRRYKVVSRKPNAFSIRLD